MHQTDFIPMFPRSVNDCAAMIILAKRAHRNQLMRQHRERWAAKHPEKAKEAMAKYLKSDKHKATVHRSYVKNKPRIAKYHAERHQKNKVAFTKRNKAWWKAHPEKLKAKDRRRYLKHREARLASSKAWSKKNHERRTRYWKNDKNASERSRKWYLKNRELVLAKRRKYYENNKEYYYASAAKRRA
jgi:hypothetical protein